MWLIGLAMMFILLMLAVSIAGRGAEIRRLTRAVEERTLRITELRNRLQESESRLQAISARLRQLEALLEQIEQKQRAGGRGHLRLDRRGRLLEET